MDDNTSLQTPGERLRWARENGTDYRSASDAARAFGWAISTYLGHENGDRIPSREAAKQYALAYHVPWYWLLEGGALDAGEPQNDAASRLKAIRSRAIGLRELARAIGWKASKYQYYEDAYKKAYMPLDLIELIRPHLRGRGEPPVTDAELDSLLPPPRTSASGDGRALLAVRAMVEASASKAVLLAFIDEQLAACSPADAVSQGASRKPSEPRSPARESEAVTAQSGTVDTARAPAGTNDL